MSLKVDREHTDYHDPVMEVHDASPESAPLCQDRTVLGQGVIA